MRRVRSRRPVRGDTTNGPSVASSPGAAALGASTAGSCIPASTIKVRAKIRMLLKTKMWFDKLRCFFFHLEATE